MLLGDMNFLRKYGIIPEILCVVNSENVKYPLDVYDFLKELGAKYISFLPLVEPETEFSLRSKQKHQFLQLNLAIF